MEKDRLCRAAVYLALLAALFSAGGCALRPAGNVPAAVSAAETAPSPSPTEAVTVTVEYRADGRLLGSETVVAGECPRAGVEPPDVRLLGWLTGDGQEVVPSQVPVWEDTVYSALTRPLLAAGTAFLFPDANGLLRPESPFTRGDAAAAVRALLPEGGWLDDALPAWEAEPAEPLAGEALEALLEALFPPEEARFVFSSLFSETPETVSRAQAAWCLTHLLGEVPARDVYYPDLSPERWAAAELRAAAAPGSLTAEGLMEQTKEGFVWFDGYLYRLGEDGYFLTGQEADSLYFDADGRYTCGNAELDGYVAAAIVEFSSPENTRLEDLHALYFHVKNDFQYLRRNFHASGETGWDIEEALTIFRTNKGNCYCYAGAFCALARGMGYNAVTYSGTIGVQEQPHAWTEITLDDGVYICDPEIEMNYWVWLQNYTDNFMMRREKSGGWNYIALGRTVQYE